MNFLNKMERKIRQVCNTGIDEIYYFVLCDWICPGGFSKHDRSRYYGLSGFESVPYTAWTDLETGELGVNSAFRTG